METACRTVDGLVKAFSSILAEWVTRCLPGGVELFITRTPNGKVTVSSIREFVSLEHSITFTATLGASSLVVHCGDMGSVAVSSLDGEALSRSRNVEVCTFTDLASALTHAITRVTGSLRIFAVASDKGSHVYTFTLSTLGKTMTIDVPGVAKLVDRYIADVFELVYLPREEKRVIVDALARILGVNATELHVVAQIGARRACLVDPGNIGKNLADAVLGRGQGTASMCSGEPSAVLVSASFEVSDSARYRNLVRTNAHLVTTNCTDPKKVIGAVRSVFTSLTNLVKINGGYIRFSAVSAPLTALLLNIAQLAKAGEGAKAYIVTRSGANLELLPVQYHDNECALGETIARRFAAIAELIDKVSKDEDVVGHEFVNALLNLVNINTAPTE